MNSGGIIHVIIGPKLFDRSGDFADYLLIRWREVEVSLESAFTTAGGDLHGFADTTGFLLNTVAIIHVFSPICRIGPHSQSRGDTTKQGNGEASVVKVGTKLVEEGVPLVRQRTTCPTDVVVIRVSGSAVFAREGVVLNRKMLDSRFVLGGTLLDKPQDAEIVL